MSRLARRPSDRRRRGGRGAASLARRATAALGAAAAATRRATRRGAAARSPCSPPATSTTSTPAQAYYSFTYEITYATQRPLLAYKPDERQRDPRPRVGDAEGLERRQDGHGAHPARRPLQPAREPRGDLGGREVRDRARLRDERRERLRRRVLRRPRRRAGEGGERDGAEHHAGSRRPNRYTLVFQLKQPERRLRRARSGCRSTAPVPARVRAQVRRPDGVDLRHAPGRDRAVHDQERTPPGSSTASATSRAS